MNKSNFLIGVLSVLIVISVAYIAFQLISGNLFKPSYTETVEGYTFAVELGNSEVWSYKVTGSFVNSCFVGVTDPRINSGNKTVELAFVIVEPDPNEVCTTAIVPLSIPGTLQAQKDSKFTFKIERVQSDPQGGSDVNDDSSPTTEQGGISQDGFTVVPAYLGNRKWSYSLKGDLPNPCYSYTKEVIILESFPEQVEVSINVKSPEANQICAQVIVPVDDSGEFEADEQATVTLKVIRE